MKSLNTLVLCFFVVITTAQTVANFENFNLSPGNFLNNAGASQVFPSGNIEVPNTYVNDPNFPYWSGWAISATTDVTTPGFQNQYSAIAGGGVNGSATYGLCYVFDHEVLNLTGNAVGGVVQGMYVTNSTYAYLSMLEGDGFAKKFGGVSGDDPDFFKITIRKYFNGQVGTDSVEFYLADFRFSDNSQDYIVDDWTWVDLTSLGNVEYLEFRLSSSDVGAFGINTPTYFCADDVTTTDMPSSSFAVSAAKQIKVWPNPAADFIQIQWDGNLSTTACISNIYGEVLLRSSISNGQNKLDVSNLTPGIYILQAVDGAQLHSKIFIKK